MNNKLVWLLPIVCFFAGYYGLRLLYGVQTVQAPMLVGKSIHEAVVQLSALNLSPRVIAEREATEVAEGTVLSQSPRAGQSIKINQTVYLEISSRRKTEQLGSLYGLTEAAILEIGKENNFKPQFHYIQSIHPKGTCIAQAPGPNAPLVDKKVQVYISSGTDTLRIMPQFKGISLQEAESYLKSFGITPQIHHEHGLEAIDHLDSLYVIDQRPSYGSLISLKDDAKVQLLVGNKQE